MKKTYKIKGLTCAGCAQDLEKTYQKIPGMKRASLDVAAGILRVEGTEEIISIPSLESISKTLSHPIQLSEEGKQEVKEKKVNIELVINLIGVNVFVLAIVASYLTWPSTWLFLLSYAMIGGKVIYKALRNGLKGHLFDEHFLMTVATIGAIGLGEMVEAVAVMLFYRVGEFLQDVSVHRSRKNIKQLMDIKPEIAHLIKDETIIDVHPITLRINDHVLIRVGERIPVDGTILQGETALDVKSLTGESMPKDVSTGDQVLSGSLNLTGLLKLRVDQHFEDSMATKIIQFVEDNQHKKAKTELFITRFSKIYTPFVVFIAVFLAFGLPLLFSMTQGGVYSDYLSQSIHRALVLLVISCPCALVLSIPLSYFAGIGASSKEGMLFKGGADLETLEKIDHFVFDKTGTLTRGVFEVTQIESEDPETLLEVVAHIESFSNHPIAQSILRHYQKEIDEKRVTDYQEIHGKGVKARYNGVWIYIGNQAMIEAQIGPIQPLNATGTVLYASTNEKYLGHLLLSDSIKQQTRETLDFLRRKGKSISMITGDSKQTATHIGNSLGIKNIHYGQLPDQKAKLVETIRQNERVAFIGDGMNDAPVLLAADLGIAMGGLGSDATIEASDAVLIHDQLSGLVAGYQVSKKTRQVIIENITFILASKGIILFLGALGYASLWLAIFADVGVALIAVMNTMKILKRARAPII